MSLRMELSSWSVASLLLIGGAGCSSDKTEARDSGSSEVKEDATKKDSGAKTDAKVADAGKVDDDDVTDGDDSDDTSDEKTDDEGDTPAGSVDAGTNTKTDASQAGNDGGTVQADAGTLDRFSFFVTSYAAIERLAKTPNGFGGDLRFGETGEGAGLRGADKICTTIAETSMPGSGAKVWRAFLSTVAGGEGGGPVHAIDRIGAGPWYDRLGRLVSTNRTDILNVRPASADATIKNDLPNEDGVPNHNPDGTGEVDNHDILTGTNDKGQLYKADVKVTCNDWTKSEATAADAPRVGHSWPRAGGGGRPGGGGGGGMNTDNWMSALDEAGCGAGVNLVEMGPPNERQPTVGSGGGYGGIYCFALTP